MNNGKQPILSIKNCPADRAGGVLLQPLVDALLVVAVVAPHGLHLVAVPEVG